MYVVFSFYFFCRPLAESRREYLNKNLNRVPFYLNAKCKRGTYGRPICYALKADMLQLGGTRGFMPLLTGIDLVRLCGSSQKGYEPR
jgi:hypothetical protein